MARTVLAATPVLAVLVLMLGLRWSAVRAGATVAGGTLVIAVVAFDFGGAEDPYSWIGGSGGVVAESAFIALTIVAIIGPALGIHHLQRRSGATDRLQSALATLTPDPRIAGLLIAWFFSLFLEGAAGFGTPVALAAPFLVAAGFRPLTAVTAALVGHATGVSFGAVGTPIAAQATISGLTGSELAGATANFHLGLGWFLIAVMVLIIGRSDRAAGTPWLWGALAAVAFFVPYGLIAHLVGPELPTLGGALVGSALFIGALKLKNRHHRAAEVPTPPWDPVQAGGASMGLAQAASPYLVLVGLVFVTRLVPPIDDALSSVVVDWHLAGGFEGSVRPLQHPGTLLTIAFLSGALIQRVSSGDVKAAVATATGQLVTVLAALVAMVVIARSMSHAGMTTELASSASDTAGWWPLLSPSVGALGTFVTGSATSSNILFTELQQSTAVESGLDVSTMMGAQGFGAAIGNIVCPHNIVAAAATVGLVGSEGVILRRTLPVVAACLALAGAFAWVLAS